MINFKVSNDTGHVKWRNRYLNLAKEVSTWSLDPSRKIGAIAVDPKNRNILSVGYNGLPRNVEDTEYRLNNREEKYKYVVHAEANVIYNACLNGTSLNGSTLYVYGLPVCSECAKGIIQVGISHVAFFTEDAIPQIWSDSWNMTKSMFDEAGVTYDFVSKSTYE